MKSARYVILAAVFACPTTAFAGPRYSLLDLGTPSYDASGGRSIAATAINNHGQVVGSFSKYDPAQNYKYVGSRPFVWSTSLGVLEMSTLGGTDSYYGRNHTTATDINDSGVIVGASQKFTASGTQIGTFAFSAAPGGTLTQLGTLEPGAYISAAAAVNASGTIIGYGTRVRPGHTVTDQLAVTFTPTSATPIYIPTNSDGGGSTGQYYSFASDINDAGTVAGYYHLYSPSGADFGTRAFVFDPATSTTRTLPTFGTQAGTNKASVSIGSINSAGTIVGSSSIYDPTLGYRGAGSFIWTPGSSALTSIPSLGTNEYGQIVSSAFAINDLNQVVGNLYRYDDNHLRVGTDKHAYLYADGITSDLNDLVDFSLLEITSAADINKYGQIVGTAKDPSGNLHACILNPIALAVSPLRPSGTLGGAPRDPGSLTYVFTGQSTPGTFSSRYTLVSDPTSPASQSAHGYGPIDFLLPGPTAQLFLLDLDVPLDPSASVNLTFTYNPALLTPNTDPTTLGIYHFVNGQWQFLGGTLDPTTQSLTIQTLSLSPFMLGLSPIPEPTTLCLLLALPLTRRRR